MPQLIVDKQIAGKAYFTNQRIAFFASGLIGTARYSWEIEMVDIDRIKPCRIFLFPLGILITMKNGDKYKLSIMKRNKYIDWISQYMV